MNLQKIIEENQRLSILHCLAEMPAMSTNHQIIQQVCANYGNVMGTDLVKTQLHWLSEQGAVNTENAGDYVIATLSQRGLDIEKGLVTVPGIKQATPKLN